MSFFRDLKFAVRSLARVRALWIAVALTLALGIGANAAIFSIVRAVLLRPLANRDEDRLLVAENLSDAVLLINPASGAVEKRFDLSESDAVPGTFPIALAVTKDGARAFVALWNASEIVELDLAKGMVARKLPLLKPDSPIAPGTHPCAFAMTPDEKTLYVSDYVRGIGAIACAHCRA